MVSGTSRIAIAGAGSIGCYVGASLAAAGRHVTFLTRPRSEARLREAGLRAIDLDGTERLIPSHNLRLNNDPAAAFADAEIILIAVKSGATEEIARFAAAHASGKTIVISLQNGVSNADILRQSLPDTMTILPGMVPFNVVQTSDAGTPLTVRRTTQGTVLIDNRLTELPAILSVPGLPVQVHPDMQGILWGKLLMNLNNAPNALSNLPLAEQLADSSWRRLVADQISEALEVMKAHGIEPTNLQGVKPALLPWILRLPDFLFRIIARKMLAIDPRARSSMWEDFSRGRTTEIDYLQGVIAQMAKEKGLQAPLAGKILNCVKRAEGRPLRSHTVEEIRS